MKREYKITDFENSKDKSLECNGYLIAIIVYHEKDFYICNTAFPCNIRNRTNFSGNLEDCINSTKEYFEEFLKAVS